MDFFNFPFLMYFQYILCVFVMFSLIVERRKQTNIYARRRNKYTKKWVRKDQHNNSEKEMRLSGVIYRKDCTIYNYTSWAIDRDMRCA